MACTDGIADMCCTCSKCFREETDGRAVYRCSRDGGRVSMLMRPCVSFARDASASIAARISHGGYSYAIGCRCPRCMAGHESKIASIRASNARISESRRRLRDGV